MKPFTKISLAAALFLVLGSSAQAQVNINIAPPAWGPALQPGAQYYYIPEIEGYYDVPARQYVLLRDGRWARVVAVDGYNPNSFHPVVIDYVGAQPWVRIREYKVKYPKGGHPHGMPPGQAKKYYGRAYEAGYKEGHEKGHGKGHGKH